VEVAKVAATVFDHPWILVIVAAITLIRWVIQKGKGEAQDSQSPPPPPPSQPISRGGETQSEEERIRKFLEALGQPAGTTPPKVVPRRRQVEPKIFPKLPTLKTTPPPLPTATRTRIPTPPPPLPPEFTAPSLTTPPAADFELRDVARQTSSEPAPEVRRSGARPFAARIKLGTPQDLRTAIVLREIFGPPRSLQSSDLTSGFQF
jgi:hypothetical protein